MGQQDYVSLEVAKLLKEKGINLPYLYLYRNGTLYTLGGDTIYCENDNVNDGIVYPQPSLYEVQKWLREHGYYVDVCVCSKSEWEFIIYRFDYETCNYIKSSKKKYNTYEEALNEGIKEALRLI